MKQLALDLKTGDLSLLECPAPVAGKGEVLIAATCSLVSPGTERMLLNFGKGGWLAKARQQPEKLRQVLQKIQTDGLGATISTIQNKLGQPMPLGYSHVGRVVAVGAGATGFKENDRVVSNGPHAGMVAVGQHLVAKIPEGVSDEAAAFTVPGAIALQSIRLLQPTFGETIVVVGAGLIGQLTARLLQANGCRVFVTDKLPARLLLLPQGVTAVAGGRLQDAFSNIDGVIITAATSDKRLLNEAAAVCRKRGRIVLSGVAPVQMDRSLLYEKEISFQVSCSYGPGRYDAAYEKGSLDYPAGFVRWTAQRNFQAFLEALRLGQVNVDNLISLSAPLEAAASVYEQLQQPNHITALFKYGAQQLVPEKTVYKTTAPAAGQKIGIIGAGQFTAGMILPLLSELKAPVKSIAGKNGFHAAALAKKYKLAEAASDDKALLQDADLGLLVIATPHQLHVPMAVAAMQAGKDVFIEKPMAIDREGLTALAAAKAAGNRLVYVGYNRRFSPFAVRAKAALQQVNQPPFIQYSINAGTLPENHWLQQKEETGGRLIGELCHFIDLCVFFQESPVASVFAQQDEQENITVQLRFKNNSLAAIQYFTKGNSAVPKEQIALHAGGQSLVIDNWRRLKGFGTTGSNFRSLVQDKGHKAQFSELLASWPLGKETIPFSILYNVASATLATVESLEQGRAVVVP